MKIQSVANIAPKEHIFQVPPHQLKPEVSFGTMLKEAIQQVDQLQKVSDMNTQKLVQGKDVDLHTVMITAQKASIALTATIEVRNKVVEAYQEISRMPL
ncbi:MAG TPA: flagellar hook-basal body complex protein FliE [Savagea sp.]